MKKLFLLVLLSLILSPGLVQAATKVPKKKPATDLSSTTYLKKYMSDFGSLVAGMEILEIKGKNPDWEAIRTTLRDMEDTLYRMRMADKEGNYKEFTDILYQNLREVQDYAQKKDKKIYQGFDKMTNTCFQCHTEHRPKDYLNPKRKDQANPSTTSWLFPQ